MSTNDDRFEDIASSFIDYLDSIGKRNEAVDVAYEMIRQAGKAEVVVETAKQLDEKDKEIIRKTLYEKFGKLPVKFAIDPGILGGMRIRMGKAVLDLSIKEKLEKWYER